jgi:alkylhydroperoxidase family enzyme
MKSNFNEREIVILASTAAQVNYWARLIQALGIPPAGFSDL